MSRVCYEVVDWTYFFPVQPRPPVEKAKKSLFRSLIPSGSNHLSGQKVSGCGNTSLYQSMNRVRLTADYCPLWDVVPTNRPSARGHISRKRHRDRRSQAQRFFDDGVQI